MQQVIMIALYVLCSVFGLVCIKLGSAGTMAMEITHSYFSIKIGWLSVFGLALYAVSFLIYIGLISKNNLSYLIPVAAGAVYLLTLLCAVIIFKERLSYFQIIGSVFILFGVMLMNLKIK